MENKPKQMNKNTILGCGCLSFLVLLPFTCRALVGERQVGKSYAYVAAKLEIQQKLKAPSTAKFPYHSEPGVVIVEQGDKFIITSYVEAQNAFGVPLRKRWTAEVQRTPDGKDVQVLSANLVE